MDRTDTCGTCRCYHETQKADSFSTGECRAAPPRLVEVWSALNTGWPKVRRESWCAAHARKVPPAPESGRIAG